MRSAIDSYVIDRVRERRLELKVSQEDLSMMAGFESDGFVGQAESPNYDKKYNIDHLNEFAKILNCSPRDFLPENPI